MHHTLQLRDSNGSHLCSMRAMWDFGLGSPGRPKRFYAPTETSGWRASPLRVGIRIF
jgi:hypothetical protein